MCVCAKVYDVVVVLGGDQKKNKDIPNNSVVEALYFIPKFI